MVYPTSDPRRWNWKVNCSFKATERRLSENAGLTHNNRVCDAADRDIWLMKNVHGAPGQAFLKEWCLK